MSTRLTRSNADQWARKAQTRTRIQGGILGLLAVATVALVILAAQKPLAPGGFINQNGSGSSTDPNDFQGVARVQSSNGSGSGFLITETYLLSAAHVVGNVGASVQVTFDDGSQVSGSVVASGYSEFQTYANGDGTTQDGATPHDWALVELASSKPFAWSIFVDRTLVDNIPNQSEVLAVGYPGGAELNVTDGIISGRDPEELRTNASIDPGYSGGLLYAKEEQAALGIISSTLSINGQRSTSTHNVVPIDIVLQKIQDAGIVVPV